MAVYLPLNARVLAEALSLGEVKYLSRGEIEAHASMKPDDPSMYRAWEYWAMRAGCGDLQSIRFEPLDGTTEEVGEIARLWTESPTDVLEHRAASERRRARASRRLSHHSEPPRAAHP